MQGFVNNEDHQALNEWDEGTKPGRQAENKSNQIRQMDAVTSPNTILQLIAEGLLMIPH